MTDERPSSQIITFYSYKGGTGRSMALANVACLLAKQQSQGNRVLMIDWDLEAPGLHRFFHGRLLPVPTSSKPVDAVNDTPGLIDLFIDLDKLTLSSTAETEDDAIAAAQRCIEQVGLAKYIMRTDIKYLDLMKAGRFDDGYSTRVNTYHWEGLYNRSPMLIPLFAEQLAKLYRYVLIDSRTGLTDISGICTMLMPERLVVVFTPNRQSLTGVLDLVRRAAQYRRQSDDLRPLLVFPLPSRIETSEPKRREMWRFGDNGAGIDGYQRLFETLFREVYALPDCELTAYFDEIQVPHIAPYAYGEDIAALIERGGDMLSLSRSYRAFTERLVHSRSPWEAPDLLPLSKTREELAEAKRAADEYGRVAEMKGREATRTKWVVTGMAAITLLMGAAALWWYYLQARDSVELEAAVAKGRWLFFKETFDGNGRTCGTCHRAENNLTIDPTFIASLPKDDLLFVAEFTNFIPALADNFENPKLMRKRGLILENLDGVDKPGVMRGVPHVFSQRFSIDSNPRNRLECFSDTLCPRTGWSGDGAPQTKDLRAFARGAVAQHFTKTLGRKDGVDFRFPTEDEEKALEAFQLSLGRQEELKLPLPLKSAEAIKGQEIFNSTGKCLRCHFNAGANVPPGGAASGNLNFNTGVENLPDPSGDFSQPDDGLGTPGDGTFNTPSLVEAADTGPFFHNNSVDTIEGAVGFYNTDAFNNSPSGQFLRDGADRAIALDGIQVKAVAAFLRAINALDNIRELNKLLGAVKDNVLLAGEHPADVVKRAVHDIDDAIMVLQDGGLHPDAVKKLQEARGLTVEAATNPEVPTNPEAATNPSSRIKLAKQALDAINQAKSLILG